MCKIEYLDYNRPRPVPSGVCSEKDVYISGNDCDVNVDMSVNPSRDVVLWGHVLDCSGKPVRNFPVTLCHCPDHCGRCDEICKTHTDHCGYYQFCLSDVCPGRYRVVVGSCKKEKHPHPCPCPPVHECPPVDICTCGHPHGHVSPYTGEDRFSYPRSEDCYSDSVCYSHQPGYAPPSCCKTTICSSVRYN